jgi:hypothetical protein
MVEGENRDSEKSSCFPSIPRVTLGPASCRVLERVAIRGLGWGTGLVDRLFRGDSAAAGTGGGCA